MNYPVPSQILCSLNTGNTQKVSEYHLRSNLAEMYSVARKIGNTYPGKVRVKIDKPGARSSRNALKPGIESDQITVRSAVPVSSAQELSETDKINVSSPGLLNRNNGSIIGNILIVDIIIIVRTDPHRDVGIAIERSKDPVLDRSARKPADTRVRLGNITNLCI